MDENDEKTLATGGKKLDQTTMDYLITHISRSHQFPKNTSYPVTFAVATPSYNIRIRCLQLESGLSSPPKKFCTFDVSSPDNERRDHTGEDEDL